MFSQIVVLWIYYAYVARRLAAGHFPRIFDILETHLLTSTTVHPLEAFEYRLAFSLQYNFDFPHNTARSFPIDMGTGGFVFDATRESRKQASL